MKNILDHSINEAICAISFLQKESSMQFIQACAKEIASCYRKGGKLLICGNGGSLCDAMHFAEEMTGQFRKKRKALPAIALSDPGHLTCVSNDMGFDQVFTRGVEAFGKKEDILIVLTTSGNSENIIHAVSAAKKQELKTISFLGKTGGKLKNLCDLEWIVEGFATSDRIQEAHMAAIHIIIELVEHELFYSKEILQNLKKTHEEKL